MSMDVLQPSGDDEYIFAAAHHLVFPKLELAVSHAFAGLDVVLVAVPGADEVQLVGKRLALIGAVRRDDVDHLVDQDALAGRAAGMQAVIAVGVKGPGFVEHADLLCARGDDAAIAVRHVGRLGHEPFRHPVLPVVAARIPDRDASVTPPRQASSRKTSYSAFHGMTLRSSSWNRTEVRRPS